MIQPLRSQLYDHEGEMAADHFGPMTHLLVAHDVVELGRVTLAGARSACDDEGCPYGVEFDLSPTDARSLAAELVAAADWADRSPSGQSMA